MKGKKTVIVTFKDKGVGVVKYNNGRLLFDFQNKDLEAIVKKFMATPRSFVFGDEKTYKGAAAASLAFFDRFCLQLWEIGLDFK